jgi:glycosyltransferase involved in cell wall biosynthesis
MRLRLLVNFGRDFRTSPEPDRARSGISSAALSLCATLARRGHELHFFSKRSQTGLYEGVWFHDRSEFARFCDEHPVDVLVVIPEVLPLLMPVRARARVVWSGNAHASGDCALVAPWTWDQGPMSEGAEARLFSMALLHPHADRLLVKSQWQAQYVSKTLGIPVGKFRVVYNGVPLEHYQGPAPARHRHRLVYSSQARRGLDVLLRLFPQIRSSAPDSELHIFGVEYNKARVRSDLAGAAQPGVHWGGSVSKSALARELRAASLMAYPCNFKETFCTAVAEAQAAGLPVVTSRLAALTERVEDSRDGFLIPGKPGQSPGYEPAFVGAVLRLLRDDDLWTSMGAAAAEKARRLYDWERIGDSWEEELRGLVAGRIPQPPRLDPALNLLDPSLLRITEGKASANVPVALARNWLQRTWTSYGYDSSSIPGLPPG